MKVWAVANQKGGVGKTTTTVNLAGLLAAAGRRTLVIDLDPHGSLSAYFGFNPDEVKRSVFTLFQPGENDPESVVHKTNVNNLFIVPASSSMVTLDRQMGSQEGKGLIIYESLRKMAGQYQHVLIDCPPVLGVLMVNAMAAAQRLVIPVQTEFLALKGLERMIRTISMINNAKGKPMHFTVVPTMYDRRTRAARESMQQLKDQYPDNIWDHVIPVDTQFREASSRKLPLSLMNPRSRGAAAYRRLLMSLLMMRDEPLTAQAEEQQRKVS